MAKYAMLNCWNDLNRGDLGIMLATVEEIRRQDENAEIIAVSSYDVNDAMYEQCHKALRRSVPQVYPALFGVLGMKIFGKFTTQLPYKLIAFALETIRYAAIKVLPKKIGKSFLRKSERQTLEALMTCDVCFSKGGSIFTDYDSRRGKIALIRLCRMYTILYKYGCPYYILGQSFGPIKSKKGVKKVNKVIHRAQKVYIREKLCVTEYPEIDLKNNNVIFSNDAGFLLQPQAVDADNIDEHAFNVGLTVRNTDENIEAYVSAITAVITYLIKEKEASIHIFQQVAMEQGPDNQIADLILEQIPKEYLKRVYYHTEELLPQELCWKYGKMDAFIGTRLHSTIFAMAAGTPALGLIYHGTKAQGIFENIGISELIVRGNVSYENIIEKFQYLQDNYETLRETVRLGVQNAKSDMRKAINQMVEYAKTRSVDRVNSN